MVTSVNLKNIIIATTIVLRASPILNYRRSKHAVSRLQAVQWRLSAVFHFFHTLRSAGPNRFVIQLIIDVNDYQCLNFTNTECDIEANGFSGDSGHVGQSYILSCSCQNVNQAVTYTWMKNNALISGEIEPTFTLSQLTLSDAGRYSCSIELNSVVYKSSIDITIQSKFF